MAQQSKLDIMYMKMAYDASELSHSRRHKVGAVLVVPEGGRFEGVNGTPEGFDNCCEESSFHNWEYTGRRNYYQCDGCKEEFFLHNGDGFELPDELCSVSLKTKPECLHAETNAIAKITRSTASSLGSTMYTTLTPCLECAKLIIQVGIVRVVYSEEYPYRGHSGDSRAMGLELLERAKIQVDRLDLSPYHVDDDLVHETS